MDHRPPLGDALSSAGYAYQKLSESPQALARYNEAIQIYEELGDRTGPAFALTGAGEGIGRVSTTGAKRWRWLLFRGRSEDNQCAPSF